MSSVDAQVEGAVREVRFPFLPENEWGAFWMYCVFDGNGRLILPNRMERVPAYPYSYLMDIYYLPKGVYYVVEIFRGAGAWVPVNRVFMQLIIDDNGAYLRDIREEDVPPGILAKAREVGSPRSCVDLYHRERYKEGSGDS